MAKISRENLELPAYEPIQLPGTANQPFPAPSESDDDLVKPTSKLPPKPLPGRPKYRPFIVASLTTIVTIVILAVLCSIIDNLMPDAHWDGIKLTGSSCDLVNTKNSSRLQSAFQINLRGGAQLSFGQAKLIDLLFDLLVGQGGRLLLAAISYIVFMDALLRSMEITPVPYNLYASLVFSPTSLIATWHSIRAVSTTRGWRAKAYLIWCAWSMLHVLAFPTLIDSATGYVSPSSAGFNIANGTMVTADSNELIGCLNVTGGLLLGQTENITIARGPPAHIFDPARSLYTVDTVPSSLDQTTLFYALITDQLQEIPFCIAQSYFVWGFSSIILYIILVLQIIWTFGMFCVWLDANLASELVRHGRTIRGPFRAAADLVEAMNGTLGHEYCAYTEKEISHELKKSGDRLRYNTIPEDDRDGLLHVGVTTNPSARVLLSDKRLYGKFVAEETEGDD
ncbi:MAG: hypothetical protein Q9196_006975 [Gyalolechia fulgens]